MSTSLPQKVFLENLLAQGGERLLKVGAEGLPAIKTLVDGGWIRLIPARCGPLAVSTGQFFARVTDACRAALAESNTKDHAS